MSVLVHGEISANGKDVVIMAAGPDYAVAAEAKKLALITPLVRRSDPPGALLMPLSWPGCVQIAFTFGQSWVPGPKLTKWLMAQVSMRTGHQSKEIRYPLPPAVRDLGHSLYWWQTEDVKMIAHCGGGLVTDDPGLGKTISAIVGLAEREAWGYQVTPIVAVVPPGSMIDSWVRAFELWAPHWRTVAWRGTPAKRQALVGTADVYVTGYAMARKDAAPGISLRDSPLARIAPVSVIADEIQNINNPDAVQTRAVQRLVGTASAFVPMSGTPVTHSVKGLWPTLKVFEDGAFPAGERFVNRYALEVPGDYGAAEIIGLNPHTEPEFRTVLLGRMLRHNKRVCLPDLPDKVYSVREVEIPAAYKKAYRSMEEKMVAELPDGGEITVMGTLAKIIRLQQMSSAAADVETYFELDGATGEMKEKQKVTLRMPSWKVDALLEILAERPGTQTLVFAPSRQLLVLAGKAAEKAGYRVGYIMGGQNIVKERTPTIDAFQAGQIDVMMIVSSAGGAGLTLTKASTEVFLQRPYSFVESTQCEDRGWGRVDGSALKSVEIIDVRAKATIDGRIPAILYDKAEQTSELLRDPRIVAELLGGNTRRHLQAVS